MSLFLFGQISHRLRATFISRRHLSLSKIRLRKKHGAVEAAEGEDSVAHEFKDGKIEQFVPFSDMIRTRQLEARRSILVQVQSPQSCSELHSYCSSIAPVHQMLHYTVGVEPLNFILVEFASEQDVANVLSSSSHADESQVVPVHSQFLWFRASNLKGSKHGKHSKNAILSVEDGNKELKPQDLTDLLREGKSVSDQMTSLYDGTKLNDMGVRLRFLTARQIESAIGGMFPEVSAIPFGSSVNGCGKMGCDLDLVLQLTGENEKNESRLVFHCKESYGSERSNSQKTLEALGDLLQLFLPGCAQVRRILQARVPIVKYHQQLTEVECDLSMTNLSGVYMSDFLYLMGSMDPRMRPLVFTIKKWAQSVGITNPSPGRWITNFSLTLLVIAFLQRPLHSPPILPSLNTLIKLAGPGDRRVTEDGIDCTFLRDIRRLPKMPENAESLESLLAQFFEFYAQFDFKARAICLNEPASITKPEHCAIYIVNPLERGLNVSKNVSLEELERFRVEARNAAWLLESQGENRAEKNWGLLSIFESKRRPSSLSWIPAVKSGRLMQVSALFDESQGGEVGQFKNSGVKRQVESIKSERNAKMKELRKLNR